MATKILVPTLGESVVEATIGTWHKKVGDSVSIGDVLVSLETDKVDLDVEADVAGVLTAIERAEDEDVTIGDTLGIIEGGSGAAPVAAAPSVAQTAPPPTPAAPVGTNATPVAVRVAAVDGVNISQVSGTGKGGKIMKSDVQSHATPPPSAPSAPPAPAAAAAQPLPSALANLFGTTERQERVKMSRRRRTIAKRLLESQHTTATLTTFNEIDMSAVIDLRKRRKGGFEEKFGTRLGYTSFFTKASVAALKAFPRLNAEIDGDEMVLKSYYDIGIAVGAEEGLVVPVLRDADTMSFADIESTVRAFAKASRDGSLGLADLVGGSFTITNGGVFGSMLSTPILNPPQVAILGLHNIVERPVAINGEVVIRPIMYAALSYDHRIVDGNEAVRFLYMIKELMEDPEALFLAG